MNSITLKKSLFFLKTLFFSYLLTVILLFVLAFILYKLQLSNTQIQTGIYFIYILSCFLSGFLTGKRMKNRRFLWGALMGVLYFVVLLLVSFLSGKPMESGLAHLAPVLGICVTGGMAGGMLS